MINHKMLMYHKQVHHKAVVLQHLQLMLPYLHLIKQVVMNNFHQKVVLQ